MPVSTPKPGGGSYSAPANDQPVATPAPAEPLAPASDGPEDLPEFSYDLNGVNPAVDLQHNQYLRGYGYDKSTTLARGAQHRAALEAQLQAGLPQFGQQLQEGLTDAGESSAARGAARSTSRLLSQNKVQRDVSTREAAFRAGISDQQAQAAFATQDHVADLDRQKSDSELDARYRLLEQQNEQVAIQRALAQMGLL